MNTLIVLSALVSAALAVPYSAKLIDNYGPAVYAQPQIISAPAYERSYAAPLLTKGYATQSLGYATPEISYGGPILAGGYGYGEQAYGKGYGGAVSTQYSIKHDVQPKAYAQPILTKSYAAPALSYATPILSKGYATRDISYDAPILTKSYGPQIVARSYDAPILSKSYAVAEPVLTKSYGYGLDAGLSYGKLY